MRVAAVSCLSAVYGVLFGCAGVAVGSPLMADGQVAPAASSAAWVDQTVSTAGSSLSGVAFSDDRHGFVVGIDRVVHTGDGGVTWTEQNPGTSQITFYGVATPDSDHAWMVGNDGTIITTSDAGESFTPQTSGTTELLSSVAFPDATHGWIVGSAGTILATADGGSTWAPQTNPDPGLYDLNGVSFSDSSHGWAVGKNGTILVTVDGGARWALQASGTTAQLWSVATSGPNHAWAVGENGLIVATSDAGATWTAQTSGTTALLVKVAFPDSVHGWAVGSNGTILATADGGTTWTTEMTDIPTQNFDGVAFPDAVHGWTVGGHQILAKLPGPPTITIASPADGAAYTQGQAVNATYSCAAGVNGGVLQSCSGDFPSGTPVDTASTGAHTFTVTATDTDWETTTITSYYTVAGPPTTTIATPADGASYTQGQVVNASYTCSPGAGGGVLIQPAADGCSGTVADGAPIDTTSAGTHTFTVAATQTDGQTSTRTSNYTVAAPTLTTIGLPIPTTLGVTWGLSGGLTITSGPTGVTWITAPTFTFTTDVTGSTFACSVDRDTYVPCDTGEYTTAILKAGTHTFYVYATAPNGFRGPEATRAFTIPAATAQTDHCDVAIFDWRPSGCYFPGGQGCGSLAVYCGDLAQQCPLDAQCVITLSGSSSSPGIQGSAIDVVFHVQPSYWAPVYDSSPFQWLGDGGFAWSDCEAHVGLYPWWGAEPPGQPRLTCTETFTVRPVTPLSAILQSQVMQVYVPGSGALAVSASFLRASGARAHASVPRIAPIHMQMKAAGPVTLKLKLNAAAKALVKRLHKVRISIRASLTSPAGQSQSRVTTVTLTPSQRNPARVCRRRTKRCPAPTRRTQATR